MKIWKQRRAMVIVTRSVHERQASRYTGDRTIFGKRYGNQFHIVTIEHGRVAQNMPVMVRVEYDDCRILSDPPV